MPPYLSLSIWIPIAFGLAALAAGREGNRSIVRWISFVGALLGFAVTISLYLRFDPAAHGMQFVEMAPWIVPYNINSHLGVDGISVLFVMLNSFITILAIVGGWVVIEKKPAQYFAAFLIMSSIMNGVFASLDAILFYVFFEAML